MLLRLFKSAIKTHINSTANSSRVERNSPNIFFLYLFISFFLLEIVAASFYSKQNVFWIFMLVSYMRSNNNFFPLSLWRFQKDSRVEQQSTVLNVNQWAIIYRFPKTKRTQRGWKNSLRNFFYFFFYLFCVCVERLTIYNFISFQKFVIMLFLLTWKELKYAFLQLNLAFIVTSSTKSIFIHSASEIDCKRNIE
jgi:cytochrome b561